MARPIWRESGRHRPTDRGRTTDRDDRRRPSRVVSLRAARPPGVLAATSRRPAAATCAAAATSMMGVARLKDGVTVEAPAPRSRASPGAGATIPGLQPGSGRQRLPLAESIVGDIRPMLLLLLGGAALLLAIACVNVVSLLLVRSEGASASWRFAAPSGPRTDGCFRQFVTEATVLVAASPRRPATRAARRQFALRA